MTSKVCSNPSCKAISSKLYEWMAPYQTCNICSLIFCSKCCELNSKDKGTAPAPNNNGRSSPTPVRVVSWFCIKGDPGKENPRPCKPEFFKTEIAKFKESIVNACEEKIDEYMQKGETQQLFWGTLPDATVDEWGRFFFRSSIIVRSIAEYTPLGYWTKLAKVGVSGVLGAQFLCNSTTAKILEAVVGAMKDFGATNLTTLRTLYYLSCRHQKTYYKTSFSNILSGVEHIDKELCPVELLDDLGEYLGPAQWLYAAMLPYPHNNKKYSIWYLTHLIKRQKWTILACYPCATSLPESWNGTTNCPAFGLFARNLNGKKELILAVRGSVEGTDWVINVSDNPKPFDFIARDGEKITGVVHSGMYDGAMAILDFFGM